jgi:hypothetical protein
MWCEWGEEAKNLQLLCTDAWMEFQSAIVAEFRLKRWRLGMLAAVLYYVRRSLCASPILLTQCMCRC